MGTGHHRSRAPVAPSPRVLYPLPPMNPRPATLVAHLAGVLPLLALPLARAQDADAPAAAETPRAVDPADPAGRALELSLQDAIDMALANNLDLEIETLAADIARYDYLGSWGAFDPVFRLSGSFSDTEVQGNSGLAGGTVVTSDSQAYSTSLSLPFTTGGRLDLSYDRDNTRTNNSFALFDTSTTDNISVALTQPLLRGAWNRFATSDQREAEVNYEKQSHRFEEIRQRVVRDVAVAYWELVGARELLGVREVALETGERQLAQDQERRRVGVGTAVQVLQSETNVAQLQEQRLLAESDLRAAEDALRMLLFQTADGNGGQTLESWDWPVVPTTPLPEVDRDPMVSWTLSLDQALVSRPELRQQRLEIEASEVRLERARSGRLPGLDLTLSANSSGFGADPDDAFQTAIGYDFPTYTGTLSFDVPLRNRTAGYAERAARVALRSARIGYDRVELTVLSEVRTAVRDVRYASQGVVAAEKSVDLAERQLAAENARYDEGLSTTFQVLEFQRDLVQARSNLTTARGAWAKALASLAHAEGRVDSAVRDAE